MEALKKQGIKRDAIIILLIIVCMISSICTVPEVSSAASDFRGKSVLIVGDTVQADHNAFLTAACRRMHAKRVTNKAVKGSTMALSENDKKSVYARVKAMSYAQIKRYDIVVIAAGTYDFGNYKNHGKNDLGSISSTDVKTTCGALRATIEMIQEASPSVKIIVSPPIYRFYGWSEEDSTMMKKRDCDKIRNRFGYTLRDYAKRMRTVANEYNNVYVLKEKKLTSKKEMQDRKYTGNYLKPRPAFARNTISVRAKKQLRKIASKKIVATTFKGKKVLVEGDSIQAGFGKFMQTACGRMKAKKIDNHAVNGATVAYSKNGKNSVYARIMAMSDLQIKKYKIIVIAAGTNDFGNYKNHGKRDLGGTETIDPRTTCGALRGIIERVQTVSPKTKIIVCPPIYRFHGWTDNNYTTRVDRDCDKIVNRFGYTLRDYAAGMRKVAKEYKNVYVLNETKLATKAEMHDKLCTGDYCHPREKFAREKIAPRAEKQLEVIAVKKIY